MPSAWARASPGWPAARCRQIGNVGPDLGQSYIVDSFMVVVLGGVGQLAGTVYAASAWACEQAARGWSGAVLAKIMVLVFIIIFIQKRPQGIFALKGRSAEHDVQPSGLRRRGVARPRSRLRPRSGLP